MSVFSGFAVVPKPSFEGFPPLLPSHSFTSRQDPSPTVAHGPCSPPSLTRKPQKTIGFYPAPGDDEEDDDQASFPPPPHALESRSSRPQGSEEANLSPRRFSLFHPTAVTTNQHQRGSNHRAGPLQASQISSSTSALPPPPLLSASNKPSGSGGGGGFTPPSLMRAASLPPQIPPPQPTALSQSLPALPLTLPPLSCPAIPSESVRSVTPPPTIIDKQVDERNEDEDDGWVSISTVNMSPFMVLRIKALIELASVEPASSGSDPDIYLKVANETTTNLKPCLKSNFNVCDETCRLERVRSSMDPDERYVALLNDLLETARQTTPPPSIAQINETYNSQYKVLNRSASATNSRARLSFSEGASLLCFDSSEKPRRVKDNHKRHFAKFLSYQRSSSGGASGMGSATSSLMGIPKMPALSPPMSFPDTTTSNLSPQMPSPSSASTQAPSPTPQGPASVGQSSSPSIAPGSTQNKASSMMGSSPSPPLAAMPPIRPLVPNTNSVPRHISPRLTEAFVSSITSNTSASAAVLASVLQTDGPGLRVYGQTVKAPPLTSLLSQQQQQQQHHPVRQHSASMNNRLYGAAAASRTAQ